MTNLIIIKSRNIYGVVYESEESLATRSFQENCFSSPAVEEVTVRVTKCGAAQHH